MDRLKQTVHKTSVPKEVVVATRPTTTSSPAAVAATPKLSPLVSAPSPASPAAVSTPKLSPMPVSARSASSPSVPTPKAPPKRTSPVVSRPEPNAWDVMFEDVVTEHRVAIGVAEGVLRRDRPRSRPPPPEPQKVDGSPSSNRSNRSRGGTAAAAIYHVAVGYTMGAYECACGFSCGTQTGLDRHVAAYAAKRRQQRGHHDEQLLRRTAAARLHNDPPASPASQPALTREESLRSSSSGTFLAGKSIQNNLPFHGAVPSALRTWGASTTGAIRADTHAVFPLEQAPWRQTPLHQHAATGSGLVAAAPRRQGRPSGLDDLVLAVFSSEKRLSSIPTQRRCRSGLHTLEGYRNGAFECSCGFACGTEAAVQAHLRHVRLA